jgi:hypothetical protein
MRTGRVGAPDEALASIMVDVPERRRLADAAEAIRLGEQLQPRRRPPKRPTWAT